LLHCGYRAHGVVVSHPLSMREALSSIPSVSIASALHRPHPRSADAGDYRHHRHDDRGEAE
jgi:hypothetical protein